jgi:HTH-type transcriptional regulator/antitoxin HigA
MHGDDTAITDKAVAAGLFAGGTPDDVPPPGDTLVLRLEELGMTQAELALRTGLTTKHLSQVTNGLVALTPDVALRLEYATGVPARWWNRLEADFRSAQTRLLQEQAAGEHDKWVRRMPVRHLVRLGALPASPDDTPSRLGQLLSFFGVATPDAYDALWARPAAAFKQSSAHPVDGDAVAAWLRMGELAADTAATGPFDSAALRSALPALRALTREPLVRAWPQARDLLASCGVAVVLVPEVPGARAYGACRWRAGTPLVQLSLRGKTDDAFWRTLFHELGHVLLHGRRASFVEFDDDADMAAGDGPEAEADRFADERLFADLDDDALAAIRTDDDAAAAADAAGIGAGLVVARLHALGLWDRRRGGALRRRTPSPEELLADRPVQVRPRPQRRLRTSGEGPAR